MSETDQAEEVLASLGDAPLKVLMSAFRGVYVIQDGRFRVVSRAFSELLGYGQDELTARPLVDFLVPEMRERYRELLAAREKGLAPPSLVTAHLLTRDGAVVEARVHSISETYRGERALVGVFLSLRVLDDSERQLQLARDALAESEETFRRLFFLSPCPMLVSEPSTLQFLEVNDAAIKLYGYSREEWLAMRITDLRPEEDAERVASSIRNGEPEVKNRGMRRHRCKDGRYIDVHLWRQFLRYKGREASLVVMDDLTERVRKEREEHLLFEREQAARRVAEEQRRRADFLAEAGTILARTLEFDETLKALARLAVPGFADWCTIDVLESPESFSRRAVLHAEPAKEYLLHGFTQGYTERLRGTHPLMRALFQSETVFKPTVTSQDLEGMSTDQAYRDKLRELGMSSLIVMPLMARGRSLGAMTFVRGPRQPLFSTEDLVLAQQLALRAALAGDNARLYEQARRSVSVRDEFMSIASHELKTPLTALLGYLQYIQLYTRKKGAVPEGKELASMLDCAELQSQRMLRLVNDLLDVARIRSGKLSIVTAPCDLRAIVGDVMARLASSAAAAGSTVTLKAPETLSGRWDQTRIEQVVTNLLSNAIKYGNGLPIEVGLERTGDTVRLVVSDQGIGIPSEMREQIFERFERLVSPNDYAGLGLGLYIVRQIVEAHGGRIRIESREGTGSTFEVTLPSN